MLTDTPEEQHVRSLLNVTHGLVQGAHWHFHRFLRWYEWQRSLPWVLWPMMGLTLYVIVFDALPAYRMGIILTQSTLAMAGLLILWRAHVHMGRAEKLMRHAFEMSELWYRAKYDRAPPKEWLWTWAQKMDVNKES